MPVGKHLIQPSPALQEELQPSFRGVPSSARPASRVNAALIGAGNVVRTQYLPLLQKPEATFKVSTVYDTNRAAALHVASLLSAEAATSLGEAINNEIDAVFVCTPVLDHAGAVVKAMEARKHVLCEKPLASTAEEAAPLLEAAQVSGVAHMVRFNYRFRTEVATLASLIHSGLLGRIYHLRATRSHGGWFTANGYPSAERDDSASWRHNPGGGVLLETMPHLIDLCCWLLDEVEHVSAWTRRLQRKTDAPEDCCGMVLMFRSGAVAQLMASRWETGRREHFLLEVAGSEGAAIIEEKTLRVWTRATDRWEIASPATPFEADSLEIFGDAIRGGKTAVPTFLDGLRTNCVIDVALASAQSGRMTSMATSTRYGAIYPRSH